MSEAVDRKKILALGTESRNPDTMNIGDATAAEIVSMINAGDKTVAFAVEKALPAIASAAEAISRAMSAGGRLVYCGAGTSGRLGVLDAAECRPTYGVDDNTVIGLMAGGREAMFAAAEGAEDSGEFCKNDLKSIDFNKNDVLVAIAASGRTPYCIGGLKYAASIGAVTVSVSCNADSEMSKLAQIPIEAVTGPEPVTGSTRMKSGTAQKMILNMLSTTAMILQGKVYENLMVDVQPTNAKLRVRAHNILMQASGADYCRAAELLQLTDYQVKPAVIMQLCGVTADQARRMLAQNRGNIGLTADAYRKASISGRKGISPSDHKKAHNLFGHSDNNHFVGHYVIGVDAGGTKTKAAVYDRCGAQICTATSGFGNLTLNYGEAVGHIREAVQGCMSQVDGICDLVCIGAAGAETGDFRQRLLHDMEHSFDIPLYVTNDAVLALYSVLAGRDGVLVISGTGSIVICKAGETVNRVGGWGHLINDDGSGYSICANAIRLITDSYDDGTPGTRLEAEIFEHLGISSLRELISFVYSHEKKDIAALLPVIERLSESGDCLSSDILKKAGEQLADTVIKISRRYGITAPQVAVSGSVITKTRLVREAFEQTLAAHFPEYMLVADRSGDPSKGGYYIWCEHVSANR